MVIHDPLYIRTMARIYRNGNTAIRVKDIVAVDIPDDDPKAFVIYTHLQSSFTFNCQNEETALQRWKEVYDEMVKEL